MILQVREIPESVFTLRYDLAVDEMGVRSAEILFYSGESNDMGHIVREYALSSCV